VEYNSKEGEYVDMKAFKLLLFFLVFLMTLSACNLPVAGTTPPPQNSADAVFTAAAMTVAVQLTQNSLINPTAAPTQSLPTIAADVSNTPVPAPNNPPPADATQTPIPPLPTAAPRPTASCDAAQFINDVSIPDGTLFTSGATFTKTWRLKNIGTCTWDSTYKLVFDSGDAMSGAASLPLAGTTAPGQTIDLSVNLQVPAKVGVLRGYWGLLNPAGARIPVAGGSNGKSFYVEIKVGDTGSGTETAGKFAVTSVAFSVSREGACAAAGGKYIVDAVIEVNKAGTVTYSWIYSDGGTGPDGSLEFDNAGTKRISIEWATTATDLWVDLYVDNPNHQQFGRAVLRCP
jgi:hypothetical protein